MDQRVHTQINNLSRNQIVKILENWGFACYDSESTDSLKEELRANVADGTIPPGDLDIPDL